MKRKSNTTDDGPKQGGNTEMVLFVVCCSSCALYSLFYLPAYLSIYVSLSPVYNYMYIISIRVHVI